jgi:hypothetical protein
MERFRKVELFVVVGVLSTTNEIQTQNAVVWCSHQPPTRVFFGLT